MRELCEPNTNTNVPVRRVHTKETEQTVRAICHEVILLLRCCSRSDLRNSRNYYFCQVLQLLLDLFLKDMYGQQVTRFANSSPRKERRSRSLLKLPNKLHLVRQYDPPPYRATGNACEVYGG